MLAVAMGFTACTSDDDVTSTPDTPKQITVYATTEQPSATRTSLNVAEGNETVGYEVLWSAGDKIMLINEAFASTYAEFTLDNNYAGQSTGEFTGSSLVEGTYTAYYPAGYDGTSWPTAQTYVENNIPDGVPMTAENVEVAAGDVAPISFKNEGGILRLNLKGEATVTSITISATDLDAITLSCGTGVQLDADLATPFYIAVPGADAGTAYSGLKIVITDDAGKVCTKTLKSDKTITVQRSMITDITLTANSFKATTTGTATATIGGVDVDVPWVQLWENGPKFAAYNVGVTDGKEESYGGTFTWANDVASTQWGNNWRMPTKDEFAKYEEDEYYMPRLCGGLLYECTCTWTDDYNGTGIQGLLCTGKEGTNYENNSIFLPAVKGSYAGYWSSTQEYNVYELYIDKDDYRKASLSENSSTASNPIRAVLAQ